MLLWCATHSKQIWKNGATVSMRLPVSEFTVLNSLQEATHSSTLGLVQCTLIAHRCKRFQAPCTESQVSQPVGVFTVLDSLQEATHSSTLGLVQCTSVVHELSALCTQSQVHRPVGEDSLRLSGLGCLWHEGQSLMAHGQDAVINLVRPHHLRPFLAAPHLLTSMIMHLQHR